MPDTKLLALASGPDSYPKGQVAFGRIRCIAGFLAMLSMLSMLLVVRPALAAKTDVVQLKNGDIITCEIKNLERGRLKVSTDSMGTVYIEWDDIVRLSSPEQFVVELANGRRARGSLGKSEAERQMVVQYRELQRVLDMQEVVWIDPLKLEGSITDRWDGSFSVGLDIAKANSDQSFSGTFDAKRRAEAYQLLFNGSAYLRSRDGVDDSRRITFASQYRRLLDDRWYWAGLASVERNDELGIDLRTLLGGGYGRFLTQTNKSLWSVTGGLGVVNEQRAGDQSAETNLEGVLVSDYEYFIYDSPKTSVNTTLSVFPSITDGGRVRSNLDFSGRRELVKDLFFEVSLYGTWDNRPPDEGETTDYGIVTSLGYSF
jgi:putative salt-induced outer membrane protein YdiY